MTIERTTPRTRDERMEPDGPTVALVTEAEQHTFGSAAEQLEWIYKRRVDDRKDPSSIAWLNELIKQGPRQHDHITNQMHQALLAGELTGEQYERFLGAYYWGSNYGFNKVVLPETLRTTTNELFREYIKTIIREEQTPSSHWGIFKRFMERLGLDIGTITKAGDEFVAKNAAGYQADLGHAVGYALAVEVESDFQLSMIALALTKKYPEGMWKTNFFDVHLDSSGEEEHARATCETIESMIAAGEYTREDIEAGFHQAIIDTRDFMLAMLRDVRGEAALPSAN